MNEGKEIILVAHSYGGIPGCASIEGQTVAERSARGEVGGISCVFFIASFALEKRGMSCTDTFASEADYMDIAVGPTELVDPCYLSLTEFTGRIWSCEREC